MTKYSLFMILSVCFVLLLVPAFAAASADHGDAFAYTNTTIFMDTNSATGRERKFQISSIPILIRSECPAMPA
jgi:hypothetical protein